MASDLLHLKSAGGNDNIIYLAQFARAVLIARGFRNFLADIRIAGKEDLFAGGIGDTQ